jgi:hypothetical protein
LKPDSVPSIHLPDGSILDLRVGDALAPDVLRAFATASVRAVDAVPAPKPASPRVDDQKKES